MNRISIALFFAVAVSSCTKEYDFPDRVPTTATPWVDAPLRAAVDQRKEELARTLVVSHATVNSLACTDTNDGSEERAFAQARHATGFAVTQAQQALSWGRTLEEMENAILRGASEVIAPDAALAVCRPDPVPEACLVAAARETADSLYGTYVSRSYPSRQAQLLEVLEREYEHGVAAVQAAGTLFGARETVVEVCREGPLYEAAQKTAAEAQKRPGDDLAQIVSGMTGGGELVCTFSGAWFEDATKKFQTALNKRVEGEVGCAAP